MASVDGEAGPAGAAGAEGSATGRTLRSGWDSRAGQPATAVGVLVGLVVARALVFAAQGVGFVHDDWAMVGHGRVLGVAEISSASLLEAPRPVQWLTFAGVFGLSGEHPLVLFALVTALNLVAALLLWRVLLRFVAPTTALAVAAVWVLLPNHSTLTAWGATSYVLVGLSLLLLGVLALADGRWWLAVVPLALAVWAYELLALPGVVAALLVPGPLLVRPSPRPVRWWQRGLVALAIAIAALRSVLDPIYESSARLPDPFVAWWGHFASGLLGTTRIPGWRLLGVVVALGVLLAVLRWIGGQGGREDGPTLVVGGLGVLVLGLGAGFAIPLGLHGMTDRLHVVSSIGAALVLVGLLRTLPRWRPPLLVPAAATLVVVCLVGLLVSSRAWTRSATDAAALAAALADVPDGADVRILVGPAPVQRDGVRAVSGSELRWMVALAHGPGTGDVRLAQTPVEWRTQQDQVDVRIAWEDVIDLDGTDPGLPSR